MKNKALMPTIVVFELFLHILEGSHHNYQILVRVLIDLFNANVPVSL